jgi:hypothetical protein
MIRLFRLWRIGGKDLRLLWFALRHPNRPVWLLPLVAILGVYTFEPLNFAVPLLARHCGRFCPSSARIACASQIPSDGDSRRFCSEVSAAVTLGRNACGSRERSI